MIIACAAYNKSLNARIPEKYTQAKYIVIVNTDDDSIIASYRQGEMSQTKLALSLDEMLCEALVCGGMTEEEFEPIANMQITRYNGTGLKVQEAVHLAEENGLPVIVDFDGGTGCGVHEGYCDEQTNILHAGDPSGA